MKRLRVRPALCFGPCIGPKRSSWGSPPIWDGQRKRASICMGRKSGCLSCFSWNFNEKSFCLASTYPPTSEAPCCVVRLHGGLAPCSLLSLGHRRSLCWSGPSNGVQALGTVAGATPALPPGESARSPPPTTPLVLRDRRGALDGFRR